MCYVVGVLLLFAGLIIGRTWNSTWPIVIGGFGGVMLWFSALLALVLLQVRDVRRVRSLGGLVCTECLYDISTLPASGNCPECGTRYTKTDVIRQWRNADRSYQAKMMYAQEEDDGGA